MLQTWQKQSNKHKSGWYNIVDFSNIRFCVYLCINVTANKSWWQISNHMLLRGSCTTRELAIEMNGNANRQLSPGIIDLLGLKITGVLHWLKRCIFSFSVCKLPFLDCKQAHNKSLIHSANLGKGYFIFNKRQRGRKRYWACDTKWFLLNVKSLLMSLSGRRQQARDEETT